MTGISARFISFSIFGNQIVLPSTNLFFLSFRIKENWKKKDTHAHFIADLQGIEKWNDIKKKKKKIVFLMKKDASISSS